MLPGDFVCYHALQLQADVETVSNISVSKEGRVKFRVPVVKFRNGAKVELPSNSSTVEQFYIDTAGSIVVRKFAQYFLPVLQSMSEGDYNDRFILYNHLHFSIEPKDDFLEFTFHISFLHDIYLGNFMSKVERG